MFELFTEISVAFDSSDEETEEAGLFLQGKQICYPKPSVGVKSFEHYLHFLVNFFFLGIAGLHSTQCCIFKSFNFLLQILQLGKQSSQIISLGEVTVFLMGISRSHWVQAFIFFSLSFFNSKSCSFRCYLISSMILLIYSCSSLIYCTVTPF